MRAMPSTKAEIGISAPTTLPQKASLHSSRLKAASNVVVANAGKLR